MSVKATNFDRAHGARAAKGLTLATRAAAHGIVVGDGTNEVFPAAEILFRGATVEEGEEHQAVVELSTGEKSLLNNTGSAVGLGDVVVTDPTEDEAFTFAGADGVADREVGIVQATIAAGEIGPVRFSGYTAALKTGSAVVRGQFAETSATDAEALATDDRVEGSFAVFLTGADPADALPNAGVSLLSSETSVLETAGTSFVVDMPADIPDTKFMLLVVWKDDDSPLTNFTASITGGGWTWIGSDNGFTYYWRISNAEPASYTVTFVQSRRAVAAVVVLDGIDIGDPIVDFDQAGSGAGSVTGLTDAIYYAVAGVENNTGATTFAAPSGWTILAQDTTSGSGSAHVSGALAGQAFSGTSLTGPTFPEAVGGGTGELIILRPVFTGIIDTPVPSALLFGVPDRDTEEAALTLGGDLSGTAAAAVVAKASQSFALTGIISPAQLVANTDNWNPTGLSTAAVIRVSTDASRNLTGISGGSAGRLLILENVGAQNLVLKHDATSTTTNRFYCPNDTDLTVAKDSAVWLEYDGTSTRWRVVALASSAGVTYGTPAVVLGTAAAAGSIDEAIRRDSTIVAFDATVPATQAFGDSAATGSAAVAARRDHKHAMPADPTGGTAVPAFATPAIVLGTAAAAGSAATVIRSDSTIVAFDATAPVTQAFGDSAAAGSAAVAAKRDHKHAMPTAAVTTSGLTQATGKMLGRSTASTGAIEEITVGSGLSLSAGSLTATGTAVPAYHDEPLTDGASNFIFAGGDIVVVTGVPN